MKMFGGGLAVATVSGCLGDDDDGDSGNDGSGDDGDDGSGETGDPVEIVLHAPNFRTYADEMQWIADEWERELGITVDVETRDWTTHLAEIYGGQFEGVGFTSAGSTPARVEPQFYLSYPTTDSIPNPNQSRYSNEDYDETYEELVGTFDEDERNELIGQLQEMTAEDVPFVGHGWPPFVSPVNTALWDFQPTRFLGASSFNQMGIYQAEPQADETSLVLGFVGDIETGNPVGLQEVGVTKLMHLVYDTPRILNLDGEFEDWACEVEEVDQTTIEMTLRDGFDEFTDGTELTAEDVAFTYNFLSENTPAQLTSLLARVDSAEALDDRTAQINLSAPDYTFTTATLVMVPILPQHIWEGTDEEFEEIDVFNMDTEDVIGAGPFLLEEWSSDRILLTANEDYFQGPPGPDEVILAGRGSNDALRNDMVTGQIHGSHTTVPPTIAEEIGGGSEDIELQETESVHFEHISFNMENEPLDDQAMREALAISIDIEAFSDVFYLGEWTPGNNTPVHPVQPWGREDLPTLADLYDVEEARSILEEAGYSWDDDDQLRYPA